MTQDERGRWVETCQCGRETWAKNLRWLVTGGTEPCDGPHPHDDDPPSVATEVGWCGCGEPEVVDDLMLRYLDWRNYVVEVAWKQEPPEYDHPSGLDSGTETLLAYVADYAGWTEHGGSVGGAWLTDDGRDALAALAERRLEPVR